MIVFLYSTPSFDVLFNLYAPQPFVQIYALALGNGGAVFMTVLATVGLVIVRTRDLLPSAFDSIVPARIPALLLSPLLASCMLSLVMVYSHCLGGSDV